MTVFRASEDIKILLGANIIGGLDVIDDGGGTGRLISYTEGSVYDAANGINQIVSAESALDLVTDDTHYLYWTTGTALAFKQTVPTGNEVLVATILTEGGNITSITNAGFDVDNVSGISERPTIRLVGENELLYFQTGGQIIINDETLVRVEDRVQFRNEFYRVLIDLTFNTDTISSNTLKNILTEMDSKIQTNNNNATREYYFMISYGWEGNIALGHVLIIVDAIREMVGI